MPLFKRPGMPPLAPLFHKHSSHLASAAVVCLLLALITNGYYELTLVLLWVTACHAILVEASPAPSPTPTSDALVPIGESRGEADCRALALSRPYAPREELLRSDDKSTTMLYTVPTKSIHLYSMSDEPFLNEHSSIPGIPFGWRIRAFIHDARRSVRVEMGPDCKRGDGGIGAMCLEATCHFDFDVDTPVVEMSDEEGDSSSKQVAVREEKEVTVILSRERPTLCRVFSAQQLAGSTRIQCRVTVLHHNMNKQRDRISFERPHALADGCIVCGDREFWVNKGLLALSSSYFDRLFFANFAEKKQEKVTLSGETPSDMDLLLRAVYAALTGHTIDVIKENERNLETLLKLSDKYMLPGLAYHCELLLRTETGLDAAGLMHRFDLAVTCKLAGVQEHLLSQTTAKHVKEMMSLPGWQDIHGDSSRLLLKHCVDFF